VNPIITFRNTAKIIGKGNLDTRVEIDSKDELGELADAFNQMTKDLKESRDKIQDYTKILEKLLEQKDEFIGQLGHDLKNPLTPLVGLLPTVINKVKDPEIKEALQIMNTNVEYMRELIFKTLQLAKLRSSDIKFDFEKLNLANEVDDIVKSQTLLLDENKIDIENKVDKEIIVEADKLRLAEVFKNLIANSAKFTPDIGGKITIHAKKEEDFVTVSFKDTGIGMTKEEQKKVFDEFYKADKFSSEMQSSGLGLAICKRIIDKHGGKIWVESPGKGMGTTFYFTLKTGAKNN
jgi:signal transduction histidine kinase